MPVQQGDMIRISRGPGLSPEGAFRDSDLHALGRASSSCPICGKLASVDAFSLNPKRLSFERPQGMILLRLEFRFGRFSARRLEGDLSRRE